jgi:hypothetical protein
MRHEAKCIESVFKIKRPQTTTPRPPEPTISCLRLLRAGFRVGPPVPGNDAQEQSNYPETAPCWDEPQRKRAGTSVPEATMPHPIPTKMEPLARPRRDDGTYGSTVGATSTISRARSHLASQNPSRPASNARTIRLTNWPDLTACSRQPSSKLNRVAAADS